MQGGWRLVSFHTRCTIDGDVHKCSASVRVLQCVAVGGCWVMVVFTIRAASFCLVVAGRPPRGASFSIPASRRWAKRLRHNATVLRSVPSSSAISLFCWPVAAAVTRLVDVAKRPCYDSCAGWNQHCWHRNLSSGIWPMLSVKCGGHILGFAAAITIFAFAAFFASQSASAADSAITAPSAKPARILFVTKSFGFVHDVVRRKNGELSFAEKEVKKWADDSGLFTVDCTQDVPADFTKENLRNYDIVMFYTTGDRRSWPIDDELFDYFLNDWCKQKGHGFIGVHSAADTLKDYKPYYEMLGGTFNNHPWTANSHVTVVVNDPSHPIAKPWGNEFEITDEIYQFKNWAPENVRVLMSLDIARSTFNRQVQNAIRQYHVPIAWCRENGDGKLFHMSLGHNEAVWKDPRYKESMLGGVKWILGLEPGSAKPNPELEAPEIEKGKAAVAAKTAEFDAKSAK